MCDSSKHRWSSGEPGWYVIFVFVCIFQLRKNYVYIHGEFTSDGVEDSGNRRLREVTGTEVEIVSKLYGHQTEFSISVPVTLRSLLFLKFLSG